MSSFGTKNKKNIQKSGAKYRFHKYDMLGAPDAEADNNLDKVYVDNGAYDVLTNVENPKCIIVGRTGSGKSALIKMISEKEQNVTRLVPDSMSLKYLSNSTILDYLRSISVNLNFFYKVLWKHVFIVEILKLYLGESGYKKTSLFQTLWSKISTGGKADPARKAALEYFEKWSDEFWLKSEYRIKTLEKDLEEKLTSEIGSELKFIKGTSGSTVSSAEKTVSEIKYKAEQIISEIQASDLVNLIEILKVSVFNNTQRQFFIVIDDLDKEWVSQQIVYDLIGSMIEVVKEFQEKFKGVKIVLALRDNLHQLVFTGKEHRGGQREKFTPLFLQLSWDEENLKEIVDCRIKLLTENQLNINSVFERQGKHKTSGMQYVLDRTYFRPRDVISFFNKIIEQSNNRSQFNYNLIKLAEPSYSSERLQALEDEWEENYGDIEKFYRFLVGIHNGFNVYNIKEESFAEILYDIDYIKNVKGELRKACITWRESKIDNPSFRAFLSEVLFILYRIGIIGVKRRAETKIEFFYNQGSPIAAKDFDSNSKIYVHKSLYSALKINSKEQEIDYLD